MKSGFETIAGSYVYVADSLRQGMGVFASKPIKPYTTIHTCPVLLMPSNQLHHLDTTSLTGYVFTWDDDGDYVAFALGVGSLFNHSSNPNTRYDMYSKFDRNEETGFIYPFNAICFTTIEGVRENDELLVDYTGGGQIDLWFDPID